MSIVSSIAEKFQKLFFSFVSTLFSITNNYFIRIVGGDSRQSFHSINEVCPELNELTKNANIIREELNNILLEKDKIPEYHDLDEGQTIISASIDTDKKWNVFFLTAIGRKHKNNCEKCPRTMELIDKVPNVYQSFFSILDPGKNIPVHREAYMGYLRYHLGLIIPQKNPPTLLVNGESYTWKEGEAIIFDDLLPHEVRNQAEEIRVILIVDIFRPLPWLANFVNHFMCHSFLKHGYFEYLLSNLAKFEKNQ